VYCAQRNFVSTVKCGTEVFYTLILRLIDAGDNSRKSFQTHHEINKYMGSRIELVLRQREFTSLGNLVCKKKAGLRNTP